MTTTPEDLRAWAKGSRSLEAGTELLLRAFSGRFSEPGRPWIKAGDGWPWIDFASIPDEIGGLSGGEQRFLMSATSPGGDDVRISLSDEMSLDRDLLELVQAAMAHAAGSHQGSVTVEHDGVPVGFKRVGTLYPGPGETRSLRLLDGGKS